MHPPPAPRLVIEALEVSVRDIADGRLHDAHTIQAEAQWMLAGLENARPGASASRRASSYVPVKGEGVIVRLFAGRSSWKVESVSSVAVVGRAPERDVSQPPG
jgi:hypothetical protein